MALNEYRGVPSPFWQIETFKTPKKRSGVVKLPAGRVNDFLSPDPTALSSAVSSAGFPQGALFA